MLTVHLVLGIALSAAVIALSAAVIVLLALLFIAVAARSGR